MIREVSPPTEAFELVRLKSGIMSLRSLENLETFHPVTGPEVEARILHVDQQRLVERASAAREVFVIWDVGLGAAANALTAIRALLPLDAPIEIHSFDQSLEPLRFALRNAIDLGYLVGFESAIESLLEEGRVTLRPGLTWHLHLGNFRKEGLNPTLPAPDSVLFDPYSSSSNPEMWSLEAFEALYRRLDPTRPCLLTNYTRSTAVRVSLLLAGFSVGIGRAVGEKAETTIASNRVDLLERPLDHVWLERVKVSRNSAPARDGSPTVGVQAILDSDFRKLCTSQQFVLG